MRLWCALGFWRLEGYDGKPTPWSLAWDLSCIDGRCFHGPPWLYRWRYRGKAKTP